LKKVLDTRYVRGIVICERRGAMKIEETKKITVEQGKELVETGILVWFRPVPYLKEEEQYCRVYQDVKV